MRKLTILLICCIFLAGCVPATKVARKCNCPPEDVVFMMRGPNGMPLPSLLPKGYFCDDENWMKKEDFERKWTEERKRRGL